MREAQPLILAADAAGIATAAARLREGGLVALPTETVYGLAARADSPAAVALIYDAKGRPAFNPLIVHVHDVAAAARLAVFEARAQALAAAFWPGPLTLVLARRKEACLAPAVTAGLGSVALRVPAHGVMRAVLRESGLVLAAPSANASGGISPTTAAHVAASLGARAGLILDGGATAMGIESTILSLGPEGGWRVLRPGPISAEAIGAVLGVTALNDALNQAEPPVITAPGQLARHYAPGKPMRLEATSAAPGEVLIGFGAVAGDLTLSARGNLHEAAARLYAVLHAAAASPAPRIAVAPIPFEGLGQALNDRLRRAAA